MAQPPRIFHLLQRAHNALFRAADRRLRDIGLTASQQGVLFVLQQENDLPVSTIATRLAMGKSSLTGLIDRMESKGLVSRTPNASDARSQLVHIEDAGRALADDGGHSTRAFNAALLAPFSASEQATIARFLTHVATHADAVLSAPTSSHPSTPDLS